MSTQDDIQELEYRRTKVIHAHQSSVANVVSGLSFVGACINYINTATTIWIGVLRFLKSMV